MAKKKTMKVRGVRSGVAGVKSPGHKKSTKKACSKKFYR